MDDLPYRLPLLLDGATLSNLKAAGMPVGVCAEKWILENPEPFRKLQRAFIAAGSQALFAPTFGANAISLSAFGLEDEVEALNAALVALSRDNAPNGVLVGGRLCATGQFVPPFGQADFDDIFVVYREQVRALEKAGVDFLGIESQISLADMRAAVLAARTANLPVFVSLEVDENGRMPTGGRLLPALITLQAMGVEAVGLNGPCGPRAMIPLLEEAALHTTVPLIAKPDAIENGVPLSPLAFADQMRELLCAGARIVGGGNGAGPEHIAALRTVTEEFGPPVFPEDPDCDAAAIESEAFFLGDDIIFSDPLPCTSHLDEDLIDLDDERSNAALVEIESVDDARILSQFSSMTRLPIAVHCDSKPVLDAALRYFQGRLIVDSDCQLEEESIIPLCKKYGAILY